MAVDIRLPNLMRPHAGGQSTVPAQGATIGELLEDLVRQFPLLSGQIFGDDRSLHRFVNVYLNDEDVRYLDKLDTKVSDSDTVSILPAAAGG